MFYSLRWRTFGSLRDKSHIQNYGGNCVRVSQFENSTVGPNFYHQGLSPSNGRHDFCQIRGMRVDYLPISENFFISIPNFSLHTWKSLQSD